MTPAELTSSSIRKLLADLSADKKTLERLAGEVEEASGRMDDKKLDAAARAFLAVKLHNYYSALEKMLVRIMRTLDGAVPSGDSWHRELIEQAYRPAPGIRPAVIDSKLAGELDRLRSFRHFFRNAYVVELDWAELECHRQRVSSLHPQLTSSIEQLLEHLKASLDFVENHRT